MPCRRRLLIGWTAPRTWVAGEVVTAALMQTHVRDQFRYLKGSDGTTDFDDSVRHVGTAHMLVINSVTSANRPTGTNAGLVYNTTTNKFQKYEDGAWRTDLGYASTINSHFSTSQATGDIFYADGPTSIARLAAGGSGSVLQTNAATGAPSWVANVGALALVKSGSGITTGSATTDSVSISGLGTNDRLYIAIDYKCIGGTGGTLELHANGTRLQSINPSGGGEGTGAATLQSGSGVFAEFLCVQGSNANSVTSKMIAWKDDGSLEYIPTGTINRISRHKAIGTAWTGTWTMALRPTELPTGTLIWNWTIHRIKQD